MDALKMEIPKTKDQNLNQQLKMLQLAIDTSHWLSEVQRTAALLKLYQIVDICENGCLKTDIKEIQKLVEGI